MTGTMPSEAIRRYSRAWGRTAADGPMRSTRSGAPSDPAQGQRRADEQRQPQALDGVAGAVLRPAGAGRPGDGRRRAVGQEVEQAEGGREHRAGHRQAAQLGGAQVPDDGGVGEDVERLGGQGPERRDGQAEDLAVGRVPAGEGRAEGHSRLVSPPMRIREATKEDFDEIGRLTLAAYRALETWVGDDYAAHLADVAGRARAENTFVLVAEDDFPTAAAVTAAVVAGDALPRTPERRLLGSVTLTLGGGPYFEWDPNVDGDCGFRMLAVDPAVQGRGVGPRLVAECLERARAAGCRRMVIGSTEWMTTAHRIYERVGFRRAPEHDQQWGDIRGLCFVLDL